MWKDIKERWDKGRYTKEYKECTNLKELEEWDTKEMKGDEKIFEIARVSTDWFFMQNFLTPELVDKLDLYLYQGNKMGEIVAKIPTQRHSKQIYILQIYPNINLQ